MHYDYLLVLFEIKKIEYIFNKNLTTAPHEAYHFANMMPGTNAAS
jgi:hypothetical protein